MDDANTSPETKSDRSWPEIPGYELKRELGHGGMGIVYEAEQLRLRRRVALKMVLAGEHASQAAQARFLQEAELAAKLQHPNIVQVYELGECEGLPFFVMELIGGAPLALRKHGTAEDYRHTARLFVKLARAVASAHACGVVHRDLKPGNVLMTPEGEPKITDFGLAKLVSDEVSDGNALTRSGAILGTPAYMAPEQAMGQSSLIGPGADIYALGVMLYEQICGERPFRGASDMEILRKISQDEPASPAWRQPHLPRDLEVITLKCLRKAPSQRYLSAAELADDLQRFLDGEPIKARPTTRITKASRWIRRHPIKVAAIFLLSLGILGGALWWRHYIRFVRPTVSYHEVIGQRWGVYEGFGPQIDEATVRKRGASYRLTRQGSEGRLTRMEIVNSWLRPSAQLNPLALVLSIFGFVPTSSKECVYLMKYDAEGLLAEESVLDAKGSVVRRSQFTYRSGDPMSSRSLALVRFITPGAGAESSAYGVSQLEFQRNEEGLDTTIRFLDRDGNPKAAAGGVYGVKMEYDHRGFMTALECFDINSDATEHAQGWSRLESVWNEDDRVASTNYYKVDGTRGMMNVHSEVQLTYDKVGNLIRIIGRNKAGIQIGEEVFVYDEMGRLVKDEASGSMAMESRAEGVCIHLEYDEDRVVGRRWSFKDKDGKPCRHGEGHMEKAVTYDAEGRESTVTFSDKDPQLFDHFRSVTTKHYSTNGELSREEMIYFDKENHPIKTMRGNLKDILVYGGDGVATEMQFEGYEESELGYARLVIGINPGFGDVRDLEVAICEPGQAIARFYNGRGKLVEGVALQVEQVAEDSRAEALGIRPGDVIELLDGHAPGCTALFKARMRPESRKEKSVNLVIRRGTERLEFDNLEPGLLGVQLVDRKLP